MKTVQWLAAAVVTLASLPLLAQQADTQAQQGMSATAGNTHVNNASGANGSASIDHGQPSAVGAASNSTSASGPRGNALSTDSALNSAAQAKGMHGASVAGGSSANAAGQMRPVSGELQSKLDSKTAKPGDPVIVKTTEKTRTADGVEIPKGSRLIGHVISAQAHTKSHADSQLGIAFERAELKGGQSMPIHSVIASVAPPPSAIAAQADDSADAMMSAGPMMPSGGAAVGGGSGALVGGGRGLANGAMGATATATGRAGSGLGMAAGETMGAAGHVSSTATGAVAGTAHSVAGSATALGTHATAIPGLMLSGDATGSASGMLTATGRNIQLESGTQLLLEVAAAQQ